MFRTSRPWGAGIGPLILPLLFALSLCLTGFSPESQGTYAISSGALNPVGIAVADLIGDGIPDVVAVDTGDNAIAVYLNDGTGSASTRGDRRKPRVVPPETSTVMATSIS